MSAASVLHKRIIICAGPGGVGKTTVAAGLGVAAAASGRRTAVITIDPARRLKDALGLRHLSAEPHAIELPEARGQLDALALDAKHTFDSLVQRFASTPEAAQRILANRLYQELSSGLAGSAEYMAMEKLHELVTPRRYQTVVVDTPPSAHARDLLSAPHRLVDLLASRAVSLLKSPASLLGGTNSLTRASLSALLRVLERWTGLHLLSELSEFTHAFEEMTAGFGERAEQVAQLLHARTTAFVLVTSPDPHTIDTTIDFFRELTAGNFPIAGIIANRVLAFPEVEEHTAEAWPERLRGKLRANYDDLRRLSLRDAHNLARLQNETGARFLAVVPQLAELPVSVEQLQRFADYLDPSLREMPLPATAPA